MEPRLSGRVTSSKPQVKAVDRPSTAAILMSEYSQEGKISMMWSTSFNTSPNCMHPLDGQCGDVEAHYEFGVWEGSPFVSFLSNVIAHYPGAPQGIMQFAFMPHSWE
mmetsp:Transcript_16169/g.15970  ORF Transcript_16169/g.15970 Transcript_16169/m.15970 type:complete len:107 (-) Transcript_16169:217-537(-)